MADELTYQSYFSGEEIDKRLKAIWPIGSVFITVQNESPTNILGFGVWTLIPGKFLYGVTTSEADTVLKANTSYGNREVTLEAKHLPIHTHPINCGLINVKSEPESSIKAYGPVASGTQTVFSTNEAGTSTTSSFSIMPPYFPVFMWYRTE